MAGLESEVLAADVPTSVATHETELLDEMPAEQLSAEQLKTVEGVDFDRNDTAKTATETTGEEGKKDEIPKESTDRPRKDSLSSTKPPSENLLQDTDKRPYKREQTSYWKDRAPKYDKPRKNNIKSEMTSQAESSDPVEIRKQVEFYFSDSNLLTDKFLFEKVEGHKNVPVPLSMIHSFKRMRHFQPYSAIVDAVKESNILDLVDDECVKRKIPLPEQTKDKSRHELQKIYEDKAMARSVYLKGFGEEGPNTQFDIEAFFTPHGPVNSVRLRRTYQKNFKGSVFVEFDSEETAKAFLALDPKPKWKGEDLLIKSKKQYCDDKVDDINAGNIEPNNPQPEGHKRVRNEDNERDWRDRRADDQKKGFRDNRHDRGNKYGSSGGRGGRKGKGRGGRDQHQNKHQIRREVPRVKTTTEDPIENGEHSISSAKPETSAATIIQKPINDEVRDEAAVHTQENNSKKRTREEDGPSEVQPEAKKVDTKDES